jgi:LysM repeat protein/ABC-type branched-subunit amino acid transport system substrate-binding protein
MLMLVCFAFAKAQSASLQNYKSHQVVQGETIYSIITKYNITAAELLKLNPDLQAGLKSGSTLMIPASEPSLTEARIVDYEKHRVRRKETIYGLAREYGVTVLDIKEANKELYSNELRRGDRIRIPVFEKIEDRNLPETTVVVDPEENDQPLPPGKYRVLKSEGKYRVSKKHEITIARLDELNPGVDELKEGMVINVPVELNAVDTIDQQTNQESTLEFMEYQIPPKMTMYRLTKMTGLSQDSLVTINPALKDGVRNGMEIKIPYRQNNINIPAVGTGERSVARLVDSLRNFDRQRIAVMLPFSLDGDGSYQEKLQSSNIRQRATDFYSGMMIARDSARALGINVDYDVYDTHNNATHSTSIVRSNDFKKYNSVIGPLLSANVVAVARELKSDDIPVVSPLTNTDVRLFKNLFQARPDEEYLMDNLKSYVKDFSAGKNVIIISDNENPVLKDEFASLLPNAQVLNPDKNNYISKNKCVNALTNEMDNVIILAMDEEYMISNIVSWYAAKARTHQLTIIGMNDYNSEDVNNMSLATVNYTFPQMNRDTGSENIFATHFFNRHGITPNEFATRGFDVAMDVILRQASADDLYDSAMRNGKTVMVENSFSYTKKLFEGYYNEAGYILRYQPDLSIEEVTTYSSRE